MVNYNQLPQSNEETEEFSQATGLRFRLANAEIGSSDRIVRLLAGVRTRLIQYPLEPTRRDLLHALTDKKLILGTELPDIQDNQAVFTVPFSARPLAYEVNSTGEGQFAYGDGRLFRELGGLLAITTRVAKNYVLPKGSVSKLVAFVDFTQPGEHNLFLVPGIERVLADSAVRPQEYYVDELHNEMGERFNAAAQQTFTDAFAFVSDRKE